jgi:hypothetical protein
VSENAPGNTLLTACGVQSDPDGAALVRQYLESTGFEADVSVNMPSLEVCWWGLVGFCVFFCCWESFANTPWYCRSCLICLLPWYKKRDTAGAATSTRTRSSSLVCWRSQKPHVLNYLPFPPTDKATAAQLAARHSVALSSFDIHTQIATGMAGNLFLATHKGDASAAFVIKQIGKAAALSRTQSVCFREERDFLVAAFRERQNAMECGSTLSAVSPEGLDSILSIKSRFCFFLHNFCSNPSAPFLLFWIGLHSRMRPICTS